jgi:hypothetical protein
MWAFSTVNLSVPEVTFSAIFLNSLLGDEEEESEPYLKALISLLS